MSDGRKARDVELLDAIDKLDRIPFEGIVWRVVRETRDVLQASPVGARWDPALFDVLYTSLDRDGALEEIYFHLSRQPIFPTIPFQLHRLRVRAKRVLRVTDTAILQQLGVNLSTFATFDYTRTQAIGDAAFFLGFGGLIVPSARSTAENLVIFSDRINPDDMEIEHSELVDWKAWRSNR
jgi:RES domain-containing protein